MPLLLRPPGVTVALPARLTELGRARRRAAVTAGVFRTLAVLVGAAILCGAADAYLHLPAIPRALLLLGTVAAAGVVFLRYAWHPSRQSVAPLAVAHLLERRFPRLNDSVASAVEFLANSDDDTRYGSEYFRQEAVERAEAALERVNPNVLVPGRAAWGAFWLFVLALAVAGPLAGLNTKRARTAAVRLFDPFGKHPWPTKTVVAFANPAEFPYRHTAGDSLDLTFTVSGVVPQRATVQLRAATGKVTDIEVEVPVGGSPVEVHAFLDSGRLAKNCSLRVTANDGDTEWQTVTVVAPPKLVPLDDRPSPQLRLDFPAYSDLPPLVLPEGASVVDAIPGTLVTLRAATNVRIVSAVLRPQIDPQPLLTAGSVASLTSDNPFGALAAQLLADDVPADLPVRVSGSDGTRLDAEFIPRISGLYSLRFTDEEGVVGKHPVNITLTPDPAPVVAMDRPAPAKDPLVLLPSAAVTVLARGEDHTFAVRRLFVEYRVGNQEAPWRELPLSDFTEFAQPLGAAVTGSFSAKWQKPNAVSHTAVIPVARFLKPDGTLPADGDLLTLRSAAHDWDDVTALKEPGRSKEEVTIRIAGKASLDAWLQQQLTALRPELLKLREQQRSARDRAAQVEKAAADDKLSPDDLRALGAAAREQAGVQQKVTDPQKGTRATAEQLKETVRANALPRTPTTDRLNEVVNELGKLADKQLEAVELPLGNAKAEAEKTDGKPDAKAVAKELKETVKNQKAAEETFDRLLRQLEQWGGAGEMRSEARLLADQLRQADAASAQAAGKVPDGKPADMLTKPEKTELGKPADMLNRVAERADAAVAKAERLAGDKEGQAKAIKEQADAKTAEAAAAKAAGDVRKADALAGQAADLKAAADAAQSEADALRKAVKEAGGDELPNALREAADELRKNNAGKSAAARAAAAEKLEKFGQALGESRPDTVEELKRTRELADAVDKLSAEQDELRKKVRKAAAEKDPVKQADELKKLEKEQAQLQKKAEELAEKLTRDRQPEAAEQVRDAAEKMKDAREKLANGKPPELAPAEAVDKLEKALDKLDQKKAEDEQKLSRDQKEQLAERLKALFERMKAADAEAARLQADVLKQKAWDRPKFGSLGDLDDRATAVSEELREFADKNLEPLPVFQQLTEQASRLTAKAAKLFGERRNDAADNAANPFDEKAEVAADDRSRRPLKTAIRRVEHILSALKEDPKKDANALGGMNPGGAMPPGGNMGDPPMMPPQQQEGGVPPLAQLKALRGIQAELNERTAAFDKARKDKVKPDEADTEEIEELERAQREVAELVKKIASALQNPQGMVPQ